LAITSEKIAFPHDIITLNLLSLPITIEKKGVHFLKISNNANAMKPAASGITRKGIYKVTAF